MKSYQSTILFAASLAFVDHHASGFSNSNPSQQALGRTVTKLGATPDIESDGLDSFEASSISSTNSRTNRRQLFRTAAAATAMVATQLGTPFAALAAEDEKKEKFFAPGGTLVDYKVGVTANNADASKSRRSDNSNVVFGQDYYYKFGTAPRFIPKGDTSFPVQMPFVFSQQRYDTLKKYKERVQRGIDLIAAIQTDYLETGKYASVMDAESPEYSIRPFGLLANGFLASENTGTTNELFLARWYINEVFLDINDVKNASSQAEAEKSYANCIQALNSLLGMINRSIIAKVGEPFVLL